MCTKIPACPLTLLYHSIVKGGGNKQRTRTTDTKNNNATLLAINCPRSIRKSVCQPHQREPLANGVHCFWMLPWINSFFFFEKQQLYQYRTNKYMLLAHKYSKSKFESWFKGLVQNPRSSPSNNDFRDASKTFF